MHRPTHLGGHMGGHTYARMHAYTDTYKVRHTSIPTKAKTQACLRPPYETHVGHLYLNEGSISLRVGSENAGQKSGSVNWVRCPWALTGVNLTCSGSRDEKHCLGLMLEPSASGTPGRRTPSCSGKPWAGQWGKGAPLLPVIWHLLFSDGEGEAEEIGREECAVERCSDGSPDTRSSLTRS